MIIQDEILSPSERAALRLRALFRERGFARYTLGNFEEYELYAQNREFFGGDMITFTGSGGRLMALRPDVTLSVVKNTLLTDGAVHRVYYHENVYRRAGLAREFKEFAQCGVECIGDVGADETNEVAALAWESLGVLDSRCFIDVSHVGLVSGLLRLGELPKSHAAELLRRLGERNAPAITALARELSLDDSQRDAALCLADQYGAYETVSAVVARFADTDETRHAVRELDALVADVRRRCPDADIRADFSLTQDLSYYNGVIFAGYAEGYPTHVLSGGRYDGLLRKFGKSCGAIGFSVYVDMLDRRVSYD